MRTTLMQHKKTATLALPLLFLSVLLLGACGNTQGYSISQPSNLPADSTPGRIANPGVQNTQEANFKIPGNLPSGKDYPQTKVALLLPLTGKHAELGNAMLNAAQMALFDTGFASFKLIPRDTAGTPEGAKQAAQDAVNAGAELIIGPLLSTSVKTAQPIANRARINMIAFSTDWTLAGRNTFIMGFLPFDQVERVTEFAARKRNIRNVGILAPNTSYGKIVSNAFAKQAPRHGIAITANQAFQPHSANLAPTVRQFSRYEERAASRALSRAPYDAVLMPVGDEDARSIANLLTHNSLPPRRVLRIGTGLLDDPGLATENNLSGALFAAPNPAARRKFENRYASTFGRQPPRLSTLAYDATALAATLARTGYEKNNRPAFDARSISNPNGFAGIDGIFRFRDQGIAERGLAILTYKNGRIVVLENAPKSFVSQQRQTTTQ